MSLAALPLELRGVSAHYGERTALQEIDLVVRPGEIVGLVGPNGSGKTTLLRVALGLHPTDRGEVRLFGDPVGSLPVLTRARRVAWVPQTEPIEDDVRVLDYVLYGRYAHGSLLAPETESDRSVARRALEEVGLSDRLQDGIRSLSGGERQRAILARALVQEAPLLFLDEPTTHLDIAHQLDLLERVRALAQVRTVGVLVALHDLNLAARFTDRIVVLSRGRRVADGPPVEVLSEELLRRVWRVSADRRIDPRTGLPYLVPHRGGPVPSGTDPSGLGPGHVIGGGGAAAPILRELVEAGVRVTVGALHLLDTDAEAAEALGVPAALEAPFAPLGPIAREEHRALLRAARWIVLAPIAVGPSNLANLEDLRSERGDRPVFLLARPLGVRWDFAGGAAQAIVDALAASGARTVGSFAELREALDELAARGGPPAPGPGAQGNDRDARHPAPGELGEQPRKGFVEDDERARDP